MDGLVTHRYVVSQLRVPTTNNQAREFGLDLNGDAVVDNQMGMVIATLAGQGFMAQTATTASVDKGSILMLPELRSDSLTQSTLPATLAVFKGANPMPAACAGAADTTCKKHLTGTASFQIAADSSRDVLTGAVVGGVFTAGPGHLRLIANIAGTNPVALDLVGARVKLTMLADGSIGSGILAGGITMADMNGKVYPEIQASAMAAVTRDCTNPAAADCGCGGSSEGKTWLGLLDTAPKNCAISVDEVKNNGLLQSLFAPDVTLEGQQALSIGVSISTVGAKFVQN